VVTTLVIKSDGSAPLPTYNRKTAQGSRHKLSHGKEQYKKMSENNQSLPIANTTRNIVEY